MRSLAVPQINSVLGIALRSGVVLPIPSKQIASVCLVDLVRSLSFHGAKSRALKGSGEDSGDLAGG